MAFVLTKKDTFGFMVKVPRPNDETGGWDHFQFLAYFKRRNKAELAKILEQPLPALRLAVLSVEFVGWRVADLTGVDNTPMEVNDVNRTTLLSEPYVENGIFNAWWEAAVVGPQKN